MFVRYIPFKPNEFPDIANRLSSVEWTETQWRDVAYTPNNGSLLMKYLYWAAKGGLPIFTGRAYTPSYTTPGHFKFTMLQADLAVGLVTLEAGAVVEVETTSYGTIVAKIRSKVLVSGDTEFTLESEGALPSTSAELGSIVSMRRAGIGWTPVQTAEPSNATGWKLTLISNDEFAPVRRVDFLPITMNTSYAMGACKVNCYHDVNGLKLIGNTSNFRWTEEYGLHISAAGSRTPIKAFVVVGSPWYFMMANSVKQDKMTFCASLSTFIGSVRNIQTSEAGFIVPSDTGSCGTAGNAAIRSAVSRYYSPSSAYNVKPPEAYVARVPTNFKNVSGLRPLRQKVPVSAQGPLVAMDFIFPGIYHRPFTYDEIATPTYNADDFIYDESGQLIGFYALGCGMGDPSVEFFTCTFEEVKTRWPSSAYIEFNERIDL